MHIQKTHILAQMILLSGPISEPRLTERQKCIDAGGQGSLLPHGCLHSTHSETLGSVVMGEKKNERMDGGGLRI